MAPFLYSVSRLHCMTVSLAIDGGGLGTVWGEQKARELLREAGFADPDVRQVEGDVINSYYQRWSSSFLDRLSKASSVRRLRCSSRRRPLPTAEKPRRG